MATGIVDINSDLVRKKWVREGLLQASSKSFWSAYTGKTNDAIVQQVNNESAADGHTVVFDSDGNLAGKAIKGKNTAFGKGEQKKKFSNKITVDRYRLVADNGDKFDAVNIGDLSLSQHTDSRSKLGDLFIRFKDQALFDSAQGFKDNIKPSHSIQIDVSTTALSYQDLVDIELSLRTGTGYMTGDFGSTTDAPSRAPLTPYRMADGRSIWVMMIDPFTAANIKGNTAAGGIMTLAQHADLRGNGNRVFKGLLGQIGQLVIVEAEAFFGETSGRGLDSSAIEIAGLRQFDGTNWSGEEGYASVQYSRNLILGGGALQMAFGMQPDYKFKSSQDFDIKSESALEVWMNTQKVNLLAENDDYAMAKRANMDSGVIALDLKIV